jgi:hypothetical protein
VAGSRGLAVKDDTKRSRVLNPGAIRGAVGGRGDDMGHTRQIFEKLVF